MIAAWCPRKVFAPMTFTGYGDSRVVETWFEQVLLPTLKAGQVVLLDNASLHRNAKLQTLPEPLGGRLLALPSSSPELVRDKTACSACASTGPIRNLSKGGWRKLKGFLMPRRCYDHLNRLHKAPKIGLKALNAISS